MASHTWDDGRVVLARERAAKVSSPVLAAFESCVIAAVSSHEL